MCDLWRDTEYLSSLSSHSCSAEGSRLGVTLGRYPLIPRLGLRYRLNFVVVFFFYILIRYTHHKTHQFYFFCLFLTFYLAFKNFECVLILRTPLPITSFKCLVLEHFKSTQVGVGLSTLSLVCFLCSPNEAMYPLKDQLTISIPPAPENLSTFCLDEFEFCRPSCRLDHLVTDNSYGHRRVPLHFSICEPLQDQDQLYSGDYLCCSLLIHWICVFFSPPECREWISLGKICSSLILIL